jgi:hypothetical protein
MTPFFVAGAIVLYGINAGANAMLQSEFLPTMQRWKEEKEMAGGMTVMVDGWQCNV